jgi:hypothetical protein
MKLTILHYVAKALGILVHVNGMPLGSSRNVANVRGESCGAKALDH